MVILISSFQRNSTYWPDCEINKSSRDASRL